MCSLRDAQNINIAPLRDTRPILATDVSFHLIDDYISEGNVIIVMQQWIVGVYQ